MKPEREMQQIKALAELDGWKWRKSTSPYRQDGWWTSDNRGPFDEREMIYSCNLHKMLTSYDAIIPLIQKQLFSKRQMFYKEIQKVRSPDKTFVVCIEDSLLFAKPHELCEALLKATGKWFE